MAQLDGKWVKIDTIDDTHINLRNDQYLTARNNANSADINILKVKADDLVEFATQPQFAGTPSVDNDLVNRGYVLDVLAGLRDPKDACQLASTGNVALTGEQTIDGVLTSASRILLKDQTDPSENGIWITAAGAWARATDADADAEVTQGLSTIIIEGTANARKAYALSTADPIVVGTTNLTFVQVPNPANFLVPQTYNYVLVAGDITNGYIDLPHLAEAESVQLTPIGGPEQENGVDFTLAPSGGVTRLTFAGNFLALAAATDNLQIKYSYATS